MIQYEMEAARFPPLFLIFICRASQLGSLRDKSPLPKSPRRHKIRECSGLHTHTDEVTGSKIPSQPLSAWVVNLSYSVWRLPTDLMRKLEQFMFNVNEIGKCSEGHSPK